MMISGRHQKVGITDLNIAINYLVIERILTCTGLYHTIKEKLDIEAGNIGIYGAIVKEEKDITPKESSEEDNIETEKTDILDVIFQKAKNGTLREHFESLQKIDEDTYKKFIKLLQDILNVDESIITGTRQIDLGITLEPEMENLKNLVYLPVTILEDCMSGEIERGELIKGGYSKAFSDYLIHICQKYEDITWLSLKDTMKKFDHSVNTGIGHKKIDDTKTLAEALEQCRYNPLGINPLTTFIALIEHGYIKYEEGETYQELIESLFELYFNSLKEYALDNTNFEYVKTSWSNNIYCLDALLYHIIRKCNGALSVPNRRNSKIDITRKKYSLGGIRDYAPVDKLFREIVLEYNNTCKSDDKVCQIHVDSSLGEISLNITDYKKAVRQFVWINIDKNNKKQSQSGKEESTSPSNGNGLVTAKKSLLLGPYEALTVVENVDYSIFDKLTSSLVPAPFIMSGESEIIKIMLGLIGEYNEINPQLEAPSFFGTILKELEHWQGKQERAVAKQYELVELIDAGKANDSAAHSLVALGETIKENAAYIAQLESWQAAFESNPDKWLEDQITYYNERYTDNQELLSVITKKVEKGFKQATRQLEKQEKQEDKVNKAGRKPKKASPIIYLKEPIEEGYIKL